MITMMKKTIFAIVLLFSVFAFQSCLFEDDLAFANSASERLINALKADNDSLQTASNGWAMEYFATELSPGYTMLVKFNNAGNAVFAGKSELTKNIYATDTCSYQMIGDAGPMLTFNTFNKILHAFSEPDASGLGLEGDFEFVVMKCTANQIVLKGKKRGTTILLNKLPENISWPQYFADLDAINSILFGNNSPKLSLNLTNNYNFSNGGSHIFNVLMNGVDAKESTDNPFIITRTGIRFHSALEIEGRKLQTFTLNADKSALVSNENGDIQLTVKDSLSVFFNKSINVFSLDPTKLSPKVKTSYDLLMKSLVTKYKATDIKVAIKYLSTRKSHTLMISFISGKTKLEGNVDLNFTSDGEFNITMLNTGVGDNNGNNFYSNITGYKEFATLISSSFMISTDTPINPKNIKFVSNTDTDTWFTVTSSL
jgi:hypothetical protein